MSRLELVDPTGLIQTELQKAIDLVSFGLHAAEDLEIDSLEIPGVTFHFTPAQSKSMEIDEAREVFGVWVLGNGLRDCVDAIGPSLEWARRICFLWTRKGAVSVNDDGSLRLSAQIAEGEWNEQLVQEGADFEYWPLRKKLNFLEESYGLKIPELTEAVLSISYARNCLTHRRGIVGQEDLRSDKDIGLVVRWRKMQLTARGESGDRVIEPPAQVKEGEQILIGYADDSKEFKLGEQIQFTPQEFVQLATTFMLFGHQIQQSIQSLQQARKPG